MIFDDIKSIEAVLDWHYCQDNSINVSFLSYNFVIFKGIFNPFVAPTGYLSLLFAIIPNLFKNKKILDIGAGSGIPSILFMLNGAKYVLGIDINPDAIENANYNKKINKIKNIEFIESDLFENIKLIIFDFDIYFANLPLLESFHGYENYYNDKNLNNTFFDIDYKTLRGFIKCSEQILSHDRNKKIYLCSTSFSKSIETIIYNEFKSITLKDFLVLKSNNIELKIFQIKII